MISKHGKHVRVGSKVFHGLELASLTSKQMAAIARVSAEADAQRHADEADAESSSRSSAYGSGRHSVHGADAVGAGTQDAPEPQRLRKRSVTFSKTDQHTEVECSARDSGRRSIVAISSPPSRSHLEGDEGQALFSHAVELPKVDIASAPPGKLLGDEHAGRVHGPGGKRPPTRGRRKKGGAKQGKTAGLYKPAPEVELQPMVSAMRAEAVCKDPVCKEPCCAFR